MELAPDPVAWLLAQAAPAPMPLPLAPPAASSPVQDAPTPQANKRTIAAVAEPKNAAANATPLSFIDNLFAVDWRLMPARIGGAVGLEFLRSTGSVAGDKTRFIESATVAAGSYIWQPWFAQVRGTLSVLGAQESGNPSTGNLDRSSAPRSLSINGGGSLALFPASRFPFTATVDTYDSRSSGEYTFADYRNTRIGARQSWRSPLGEENINAAIDSSRLSSGQFGRDTVLSFAGGYLRQMLTSVIDTQLFASQSRRDDQASDLLRASVRFSHRPDALFSSENMLSMNFSKFELGGAAALFADTRFVQASSFSTWRPDDESPLFVTGSLRLSDFSVDGGGDSAAVRNGAAAVNASYKLSEELSLTGGLLANVSNAGENPVTVTETVGATYSSREFSLGKTRYNWSATTAAGNESGGNAGTESGSRRYVDAHANHQIARRFEPFQTLSLTTTYSQGVGMLRDWLTGTTRAWSHNLSVYGQFAPPSGQQLFVGVNAGESRNTGTFENRIQLVNVQVSGQAQLASDTLLSSNLTIQRIRQSDTRQTGDKDSVQRSGNIALTKVRLFGIRQLRYQLTAQFNDLQLESRLFGDTAAPRDEVGRLIEQRLDYQIGLLSVRFGARQAIVNGRSDGQYYLRFNRQFGTY